MNSMKYIETFLYYSLILSIALLIVFKECQGIQCYQCDQLNPRKEECPGSMDFFFEQSVACRLLLLGNGSIVQQSTSPVNLCQEEHLLALKHKISEVFRDGRGRALCCYTNGCNRDLELALASLSYISSPLGVGEVEVLKQRATDIQRLNQFEQSKMTASLTRSGVSRIGQSPGVSGVDEISCYKCNIMTSNYQDCPGSQALSFPGSRACRLLALSDGKVVQQDVSPVSLCEGDHVTKLRRNVARRFGDGDAHVICCFTDNCNDNVETALMSRNLVSSPLSRAEMSRIVQKVEKISRAESLHLNLTTEEGPVIRGRSGLGEFPEENNIATNSKLNLAILLLSTVAATVRLSFYSPSHNV